MRRAAWIVLAAAIVAPAPLRAAQVAVSIHRHGNEGVPVSLRLTSEGTPSKPRSIVATVARSEDRATLSLENGEWSLEIDAPGAWHSRQFLTVAGDRTVDVHVWPGGVIRGTVRSEARRKVSELAAGFEGMTAKQEAFSGFSRCEVTGAKFSCDVPAGKLDVRFRAPGHVGVFRWGVAVESGAARGIGELVLRPGQSIVGRVELPRRSKLDVARTIIEARPAGAPHGGGPLIAGSMLLPQSARPERGGIFHLDGVMPGEYVVSARHPGGLVSAEAAVVVREGAPSDLGEPLRLNEPRRIQLSIDPPLTPAGERWHVSIARSTGPQTSDPVTGSLATTTGAWTSPPLSPGPYEVAIGAGFEDVWSHEEIALGSDDEFRTVRLSSRKARGRVTLGGKAVSAGLAFRDRGGRMARAESNGDGEFEVELPDAATLSWDVTVAMEVPYLRRTLEDVRVPLDAPVAIDLPAGSISGTVVTEAGEPVPRALVSIISPTATIQPATGPDGVFVAVGMPSGPLRISAEALDRDVDEITLTYDENAPPEPLVLHAHKRRELHGDVTSPFGPVAGAEVVVMSIDPPALQLAPTITGADGVFQTKLAASAAEADVVVMARGLSFLFGRMPIVDGTLHLRVDQRGGTLVLRATAGASMLVHNGAAIRVELLQNRWPVQTSAGDADSRTATVTVPMMEPGVYTLCDVAPAAEEMFLRSGGRSGGTHCLSGALDPFGTLKLP